MEIIINGKKIDRIRTLHISAWGSKDEGIHEDSFVIYDEYDSNLNDYVTRVLYFKDTDIEKISL